MTTIIMKHKVYITHWFGLVAGLAMGLHLAGEMSPLRWLGLVLVLVGLPLALTVPYREK